MTLAILDLRPNELPSWEMRERQMEEERKALRDLRKRIAKAVSDGIALLDQLDGDADLEPSLGSIEPFEWQGQETWTAGSTDERENAQCIGCDGDYAPTHRGFLSRVA